MRSLAQKDKHLPLRQVLSDLGAIDAGIDNLSESQGVLARRFDDNYCKIERRSEAGWRGRG